mgnify:CR=1 FL=1
MSQSPSFRAGPLLHATPIQAEQPTGTAAARIEFVFACATVFLAPMNVLRLESFYFTASDAFACLCLGMMILNRPLPLRPLGPGSAYWIFGLVTMIGALLASSLVAGVVDRGLILSMQYLFAYFLLPLILLARPWPQTATLMKVFVASLVVMILHGIYVVDFVGKTNTQFVSGSGRLLGFVERDNECGSLIALTVPMILSMAAMRIISPFLAWLVLLPLLAYGIMLTGSNTALYGMLYGIGIFFLATLNAKRAVMGIAAAYLVWVGLNTPTVREYLPAAFQKRVLTGIDSGSLDQAGTFADRMQLNEEAIRLGSDAMLLGYGADQYRQISEWLAPVHNLYLLIWNEGGAIALAGFVVMLAGGAITLAATLRYRGSRPVFVCGLSTLSLFAVLINAVPHVYGRFWTVPVLLSLAPAVTFLAEGPWRRDRSGARQPGAA